MSKFKEKVLKAVSLVPQGKVASYGQIALMVGVPRAAITVGQILHEYGDKYPWWRVINSAGRISTTCEKHTAQRQKEYLEKEGVKVTKGLKIDLIKYRYIPNQKILNALQLEEKYIQGLVEKYLI